MKSSEIIENNKLIAEFMCIDNNIPHDHQGIYCYNHSWDWLMPCCIKISSLDLSSIKIHYGTGATDSFATCNIYYHDGKNEFQTSDDLNPDEQSLINATYKAVVEFIKWYNNKK